MQMMNQEPITISAPGVNVEEIVRSIKETVARKTSEGAYSDSRIARAEKNNLIHLANDPNFFQLYLDCLRDMIFVDINDYEISERRAKLAPLLVMLKKTIWKLLKFYTYRLWAQQNQINGLLLSASEEIDRKYRDRIAALETRLTALEAKTGESKTT